MKKADIIAACVGLALCVYIWVSSEDFPPDVVMHIGPEFFPRIIAVLLAIACVALLGQALIGKVVEKAETLSISDPGIRRGLIVLALTVVYILIMDILGFIVATIVFMMLMMYLLKLRNYIKMLMWSIGTAIVVNLAFTGLLEIQLPLGLLENIL